MRGKWTTRTERDIAALQKLHAMMHGTGKLVAQAPLGGQAWRSDFARLPEHEQRAWVTRMTVGRLCWQARRHGKPEPIFMACDVTPNDPATGGFTLVPNSFRPLPIELGGSPIPPSTPPDGGGDQAAAETAAPVTSNKAS